VSKEKQVFLVGVFPPPVHGATLVNAAVRDALLQTRLVQVSIFDLARSSLGRALHSRLLRVPNIIHCFLRFGWLCVTDRPDVLYLAASGGLGQLYEAFFVMLARLFRLAIVVHHHSFSYIDSVKWRFRCLAWLAGSSALHVTLCSRMAKQLKNKYGSVIRSIEVSNVAWVPEPLNVAPKQRLATIGYFGNISREKGIFEFMDIARSLSGESANFVVGGAFPDKSIEGQFRAQLKELHNVRYVGSKYGAEKAAFFRSIDLLIFPSSYIHEAEPLTIIEALSNGVPVIAGCRGCIDSLMIPDAVGNAIEWNASFVDGVSRRIKDWQEKPEEFRRMSVSAMEHFRREKIRSTESSKKLVAYLCG